MRSRVRESGWSEPAGASGLGRVGSTEAPRAAAISAFSTLVRRAARSSSTDFFASLMSLPTTGRSSFERVAIPFITWVREPLGPTTRALKASSSARVATAEASWVAAATSWASCCCMD